MSDDHDDGWGKPSYKVGFGKPPKQYQFKKGESGNPKGRKKKDTTIRAIMKKIIAETITAQMPDGKQSMSALEFVLRTMRNRAAKGDNRATDKFIDLTLAAFGIGEPDDIKRDLSSEDRELLLTALQSLGGRNNGT
jgi:uncharacterized protein (DUF2267 family)